MGKGSKILRLMLFEITHLVHFYCLFMPKIFFFLLNMEQTVAKIVL